MRSAFLVRVLKHALFATKDVERADKSFFIWRDVQAYWWTGWYFANPRGEPARPVYELSLLGIVNGFLRHTPRRLAVLGDRILLVR